MSRTLVFVLGIVVGLVGAGALLLFLGSGLMLDEHASPVGLEATVARIRTAAEAKGWVVQSVAKLDESVRKHGGGEVRPVRVINLCQPKVAGRVLADDPSRVVSVMMPCRISVYEKADGKVYLSTMNVGLIGRLFGGVVAEAMGGEVSEGQAGFVEAALAPAP